MFIMYSTLMTATRTQTEPKPLPQAPVLDQRSFFASIGSAISFAFKPLKFLLAFQSREKFRSLTPEQLNDIGLTQFDLDKATLRDFAPRS